MNLLLSSAGRRVELLQCFRADAHDLALDLKIFATDANSALSPACRFADQSFDVPRCSDPRFIPALLDLCSTHKINLLVPTIDTELELLAQSAKEFQKIGTRLALSDLETVAICRSKDRTASFLAAHEIPVPKTLPIDQFLKNPALPFPVLLKPKGGSSSKGIIRLDSIPDLERLPANLQNYIAQELSLGPEYTVNMFFDSDHRLRSAVPHLRIETRSGEVSKGVTEAHPALLSLAQEIATALPAPFAAVCFQAILTSRGPVVFEINARFGGGFPLAHRAGAKFSKWLLESVAGLPSSITDQWQSGLTMLRFDSSIFF